MRHDAAVEVVKRYMPEVKAITDDPFRINIPSFEIGHFGEPVDNGSTYRPKDTEVLPLLTRISKANADDWQSLLDLCWYINPRQADIIVARSETFPLALENNLMALREVAKAAQGMLLTLFEGGGLTIAQIEVMNRWSAETTLEAAFVFRPMAEYDPRGYVEFTEHEEIEVPGLPEEEAAKVVIPLSGITFDREKSFWRMNPDRIVMRHMVDAIFPLHKGEWKLSFCEGCDSVFVYEHGGQMFCSLRCAARVRKRRQRAGQK